MSLVKPGKSKNKLHPRNRNRDPYDLNALVADCPELKKHIKKNKYGNDSIDFSDPIAVKILNKSILSFYYGIKYWDFPDENLCPPIPGRADYIHYMADLLGEHYSGAVPKGNKIRCLDIGVGASCIYPILGVAEYNWNFIASDVNKTSLSSAFNIMSLNKSLKGKVEFRLQKNKKSIFDGIIKKGEKINLSICNPPFYSSIEHAEKENKRKINNLSKGEEKTGNRNFSGINDELIYEGGEIAFVDKMIEESKIYANNVFWFSCLISKQSHLKQAIYSLKKIGAGKVKVIPMGTGNKSTRIIAWTFMLQD